MNPDCGIYAITSPSGKQYIGQALSFKRRWWEHRRDLRTGKHHCKGLQHAYCKYGESALVFSVIAMVPAAELNSFEQQEIDARSPNMLYNTALFVRRPNFGRRLSDETRTKLSLYSRNRSPEHRQKLSDGRKGKFHSESLKLEMSRRFLGEKNPKWGKKHSPETMAKLIAAQQDRSPEWRARIAAAKRGLKQSPETIAKISATRTGKFAGEQSPVARRVICIETEQIFECLRYAQDWLRNNGKSKADSGAITRACKGKIKHAYGYHWRYA